MSRSFKDKSSFQNGKKMLRMDKTKMIQNRSNVFVGARLILRLDLGRMLGFGEVNPTVKLPPGLPTRGVLAILTYNI